jgi:hypothetical protein
MLELPPTFLSVDDVLSGLTSLGNQFTATQDRRGIFVQAYILITGEIRARLLAGGSFEDPDWVGKYLVAFAELYRVALAAYEKGDLASVPKAWALAFDTARKGDALLLQHLLLGINAHINRDLPNALCQVGIDPDRALRKHDHDAINDALRATTEPVKQRLFDLYAPVLGLLDGPVSVLDDEATNFSFEEAREAAWDSGISLVNARDDGERDRVRGRIDASAGVLGRLLLGLSNIVPGLIEKLAALERVSLPTLFGKAVGGATGE